MIAVTMYADIMLLILKLHYGKKVTETVSGMFKITRAIILNSVVCGVVFSKWTNKITENTQ